ncbi:hypothetical protein [Vandammella animalimorsus]|uniref:hypothetical protein n=1 Tax=Vandammella animalimorsus TaxID=2029117 RepID=UPI001177F98A|nr:hypothetical protein [Vandammella animalimorsus]
MNGEEAGAAMAAPLLHRSQTGVAAQSRMILAGQERAGADGAVVAARRLRAQEAPARILRHKTRVAIRANLARFRWLQALHELTRQWALPERRFLIALEELPSQNMQKA